MGRFWGVQTVEHRIRTRYAQNPQSRTKPIEFRRFGRLNIHLHMHLMQSEVEVATKRLFEFFRALIESSWPDLGLSGAPRWGPQIGPKSAKMVQNSVLETSPYRFGEVVMFKFDYEAALGRFGADLGSMLS